MLSYLDKDVRTIETDDIRDFLSYYQSNNNCNNLTIDGVRRSLSSFFTFLEVEDYIVKSPIKRIHKIKTEFLIKETYSDELMERLRNSCTNIRNLAIIDLLASSGIRISELVNFNRDDINFENKSCLVFGKGKKMREVYFDGKAKLHMEEYLNNRKDDNKQVQHLLGHTKIDTTLHYASVNQNIVKISHRKYIC